MPSINNIKIDSPSLKNTSYLNMLAIIRNKRTQHEVAQFFHKSTSSISKYLKSRGTNFAEIKELMNNGHSDNEVIFAHQFHKKPFFKILEAISNNETIEKAAQYLGGTTALLKHYLETHKTDFKSIKKGLDNNRLNQQKMSQTKPSTDKEKQPARHGTKRSRDSEYNTFFKIQKRLSEPQIYEIYSNENGYLTLEEQFQNAMQTQKWLDADKETVENAPTSFLDSTQQDKVMHDEEIECISDHDFELCLGCL